MVLTTPDTDTDELRIARLNDLGVRVSQLRGQDEWLSYLSTARKFHRYSFTNQMLIWSQRPEATYVAGYRKWQEMGRQVCKGERGITIVVPRRGKNDKDEERIFGFGTGRVFDVTQTEGDPLPVHPPWPDPGTCGPASLAKIWRAATDLGLTIEFSDDPKTEAHGWFSRAQNKITLVNRFCNVQPVACSTLLHELGHWGDPMRGASYASGELVAESTAYLLAPSFDVGLDEEALFYLASWGGTDAELLAVAFRACESTKAVLKVVSDDH